MASSSEVVAWRIVKAKYASSAFDGRGALRDGGRWTSPGFAVVYTAQTISLAALEVLVHVEEEEILAAFRVIECRIPRRLVRTIHALPALWRRDPPPAANRLIGDSWAREKESAVLEVPSVVVPSESNYLINPAHRDFKRIRIGKPERFTFDPRLS